jgi:hypothetical protein
MFAQSLGIWWRSIVSCLPRGIVNVRVVPRSINDKSDAQTAIVQNARALIWPEYDRWEVWKM